MKPALLDMKLHVLRFKFKWLSSYHRLLPRLREKFWYLLQHWFLFTGMWRRILQLKQQVANGSVSLLKMYIDIFVSTFDNQQSQIVFTETKIFVIFVCNHTKPLLCDYGCTEPRKKRPKTRKRTPFHDLDIGTACHALLLHRWKTVKSLAISLIATWPFIS